MLTLIFLLTGSLPLITAQSDPEVLHFVQSAICDTQRNETFSPTTLSCVKCTFGEGRPHNGVLRCPCPPPLDESAPHWSDSSCTRCSNGTTQADHLTCLPCPTEHPYDLSTGMCKCPPGHVQVFSETDGTPIPNVRCLNCSEGFVPNSAGTKCVRCHPSLRVKDPYKCSCPELTHTLVGGICFKDADIGDDRKGMFRAELEFDNGIRVESRLFRDHLAQSFLLCKTESNQTACQILANLCTLQIHSYGEDRNTPCNLYRALVSPVNMPPSYIPKLYYSDIEAPSALSRSSAIPVQFDTGAHRDLNISVARYSLDGEFLGIAFLGDLLPCAGSPKALKASNRFAANYGPVTCSIPAQEFLAKYEEHAEFLDPYLSMADKGSPDGMKLYSLPVKVQNFRRNGVGVNRLDDKYRWQLVRRFFIADTLSGQEDGAYKVVRYLEDVEIKIQLQNSVEAGKIFVPLLTLTYREVTSTQLAQNQPLAFSFKIEYFQDMDRPIEDVKISVGVLSALAVMLGAVRTWGWNRRGGKSDIDVQTLLGLVTTCCGYLADTFFLVCFFSALYWFVFFKKAVAVHVLLPLPDQERLIRDLLIAAFSLKIVEIIKLIGRQVRLDIFFVDWERPRVLVRAPKGDQDKGEGGEVSIWRTYFIANEFAEIQTTRKIHLATHLIICIFFLEILGFKNWGYAWPDGRLHPGEEATNVPFSTSARFAVGALVFGVVGICEWLYVVGIHERYISNKLQDFVDICTLSNVSVFILAAQQFGYYIHGRSVHGFADTDMQTMIDQLSREEDDLCGRRGLVPSTDQVTFLISLPRTFRTVYNQVLQPLYASSKSMAGKGLGQPKGATRPSGTVLDLSVHAYHSMNRFLTAFLEHALSDLDYDVQDKSFFETTLDMEFGEANDRAIFYTDNGHSFDSVLFYGNERALFLFNLYTFIFVEILSHDFLLAAILTYVSDQIVKTVRNTLGKRNLARKTLIDGRFLI